MLHRQPVDELIAKNKSALYTLDMNLSGFSLDSKAFDHPPIPPRANARECTHSFCALCVHACLCVRACVGIWQEEYWAAHTQQHAMAQGGFLLVRN